MLNLFDTDTPQPLIVLRGEYGIISGDNSIIASANAKSGVVLILSDAPNKITAMAHLDEHQDASKNIEKILLEMTKIGANISNLTCNIVENDKPSY